MWHQTTSTLSALTLPLINVGFLIPASLFSSANNLAAISPDHRCKSPGGTFCFSPWLTPLLGISWIVNRWRWAAVWSIYDSYHLVESSSAISIFSVRDGLCFTACCISLWGVWGFPSINTITPTADPLEEGSIVPCKIFHMSVWESSVWKEEEPLVKT